MRQARSIQHRGGTKHAALGVDAAIAELAAGQHGVVTRPQLLERECSPRMIWRRRRSGHLHEIHQGVYAVGHPGLTREGRWLAAVLASGPGAVLSHASAAALWRIRATEARQIDVISLTGAGRATNGIRVHRPRNLRGDEVTVANSIPCTTPERTLLDLAGVLAPQALEYAVHRAQTRKGLIDPGRLAELFARGSTQKGRGALRRLLEEGDINGELARRFHAICRRACRRAGAPMPLTDYWVAFDLADGGHGLEVDFAWPDRRLAVETDGRGVHATDRAFENDRARDRRLLTAGWRVMRFTWRDATEHAARSEDDLVAALLAAPIPL